MSQGILRPTAQQYRSAIKSVVKLRENSGELQLSTEPKNVTAIVHNAGLKMPGRETVYVKPAGQELYVKNVNGGETTWFSAGRAPLF